jgi:hypothetical protein
METFKQYLPWIIGAVVVLYVLRKLTTKTSLLPQTQFLQTPQTDPYAEARTKAFELLTGLGIAQVEGDVERSRISETSALERARLASASTLERLRIGAEENVSLSAIQAQQSLANLNFLQRSQDQQIQQSAIDRYYSSRNTGSIVGSITQAIDQIFRNRQGGNIFGTPPTFPSSGFTFGGF